MSTQEEMNEALSLIAAGWEVTESDGSTMTIQAPEHWDEPGEHERVVDTHSPSSEEVERLKGEVERLTEREEHFATALGVCDGGQYRHDWDGAIKRLFTRAEAAEARNTRLQALVGEMREALTKISKTYACVASGSYDAMGESHEWHEVEYVGGNPAAIASAALQKSEASE